MCQLLDIMLLAASFKQTPRNLLRWQFVIGIQGTNKYFESTDFYNSRCKIENQNKTILAKLYQQPFF